MELMENCKVNTRLKFPMELDLEPYTSEGLTWREQQAQKQPQEGADQQPKPQLHAEEQKQPAELKAGQPQLGPY